MRKDRNHVFIRIGIHMMNLVALVEDIRQHLRSRCVGNRRGDNIRHISVVLVLGHVQLRIRIELSDSCQLDIAAFILSVTNLAQIGGGSLPYLRMVTRTDLSAARSCRSSINQVRSILWLLVVQWSSRPLCISPPLSNLLIRLENILVLPRAMTGSITRVVSRFSSHT